MRFQVKEEYSDQTAKQIHTHLKNLDLCGSDQSAGIFLEDNDDFSGIVAKDAVIYVNNNVYQNFIFKSLKHKILDKLEGKKILVITNTKHNNRWLTEHIYEPIKDRIYDTTTDRGVDFLNALHRVLTNKKAITKEEIKTIKEHKL